MNRGILATTYVRCADGWDAAGLRRLLAERYGAEPFVHVLAEGAAPSTRHVRGSNACLIGDFADRPPPRATLLPPTFNQVKGPFRQAVPCMHLMFGLVVTAGLSGLPQFP